ncbi:hypothetical protein [Bradyrhizobium paxllaeri]|uniref:hypothetical protein n=1 Tax=Bradyrhizobium paxllaeri TaxID=190148 RepID=UPI000810C5AD|nr:hypothetical protein [Bradyrhizobium paxllaeri]
MSSFFLEGRFGYISDGSIASQLGRGYENVRIGDRSALFFDVFGQDLRSITAEDAEPPSLATRGAMRETMRA